MGRLKRVIEAVLVRGGPAALARALGRRRALILAYHNIVPTGEQAGADRSLHLEREEFARHLDIVSRTHEIVPLARLLGAEATGPGVRPMAAITFDDAYLGAATVGVQELVARGLTATFFVTPGFVGGRSFWWDACAPAEPDRDAFREHALTRLRGDDAAVRAWAARCGCPLVDVPRHARCATLEDLRAAVRTGNITLGAHTWSHRNLVLLRPEELRFELERPLAWLRERFPSRAVLPYLAYPYGIANAAVEATSAAARYEAALRVDGGGMALPASEPHRTPRLNVPAGLSPDGLELRLAGLL